MHFILQIRLALFIALFLFFGLGDLASSFDDGFELGI